jgi:hypothetical protein
MWMGVAIIGTEALTKLEAAKAIDGNWSRVERVVTRTYTVVRFTPRERDGSATCT